MSAAQIGALSLAAIATVAPAFAQAPAAGPSRAYYWNVSDTSTSSPTTDAARIARLRGFGVTEVHIWLNENRKTPACGYLFHYTEGGAPLWTPTRLAAFTAALKAAGLKPVFILSPDLRTTSYVTSLAATGGPLDVAAKVSGVDIELDIEGNGEASEPCPVDGLEKDAADAFLLKTIRAATPSSKIIVSTIRGYDTKHPVLMAGADAVSPQLYGAHYAFTLKQAKDGLEYFHKAYPTKPLWPALSVECSTTNATAGLCSQALFDLEVQMVVKAWNSNSTAVPKYVVWGEREARTCPSKPLCSVFAETYLAVGNELPK